MPAAVDTLRNLRFMQQLGPAARDKAIAAFEAVSEAESMNPGVCLFQEGERDTDRGYVLLDGEVRIVKSTAPELTVAAPELLGEMVQYNPKAERTATVESATAIQVLSFRWSAFNDALVRTCSPEETDEIQKAFQDYAWEHFTQ